MKPCAKVKNPCKICLRAVSNRNGLQCQGACRKWAHFKCLHYTPGKISDIKAGIITVTCPCPDCDSEIPKEYLTNPPFTCSNHECPANKIPKCPSDDCPTNRLRCTAPVPLMCPTQCPSPYPSYTCLQPEPCARPIPPPLPNCLGSTHQVAACTQPVISPNATVACIRKSVPPPAPAVPPRNSPPPAHTRTHTPGCVHKTPKGLTDSTESAARLERALKTKLDPKMFSPPCNTPPRKPTKRSSTCKIPKHRRDCPPIIVPKKSPSCSIISSDGLDNSPSDCRSHSDSRLRRKDTMMETLQDMCSTVGKLTMQIKDLMSKIVP